MFWSWVCWPCFMWKSIFFKIWLYLGKFGTPVYQKVEMNRFFFSSPEPNAQVSYCHSMSSGVNCHIFGFSSEMLNRIQQNLTESNISTSFTKFVFFGLIGKIRWLPWSLIGWDIFDFSSETTERNSQQNLMGSKILISSTKFVFFWPIGNTRWLPWPLIGWDVFNFSSESAEQNSTKLDRKQDLYNVVCQICQKPLNGIQWYLTGSKISTSSTKLVFFQADWKNKMADLASDWLRHFSTSPLKQLNGIQQNLTGSKILMYSAKFVFSGRLEWQSWYQISLEMLLKMEVLFVLRWAIGAPWASCFTSSYWILNKIKICKTINYIYVA